MSDRVNIGYVLGQLARAIGSNVDAATKVARWERVLQGLGSGSIEVGSRTPVEDTPAWVTLEVVTGGFATGNFLAGGPLLPHEEVLLGRTGAKNRGELNLYFLSDTGRAELSDLLAAGCYEVRVAEEGALLVVAWLLANEGATEATEILEAITPFFDRLRFYPVPAARAALPASFVRRGSVAEVVAKLERVRTPESVARMVEALRIWTPLYDRIVTLFLQTVEDGAPCRRFPADFDARGRALLEDYRQLRKRHSLCGKPDNPKENFFRLRAALGACLERQQTARQIESVRKTLADFVTAHGAPGSEEHARVRAAQASAVARRTSQQWAKELLSGLSTLDRSGGLDSVENLIASIDDDGRAPREHHREAAPAHLVRKVAFALEAPVEELVERRVLPSAESLAIVVPQITSQVRASAFADPALRRVYAAIYAAFRRRRSLLLLDLARQVQLDELPWVGALGRFRQANLDAARLARGTLEQVTRLAYTAFPQTIMPNKLLQEERALAKAAGIDAPFVDELAADIFTGTFTPKFVAAAKIAAKLLRGTLYERYYDIDFDQVLALPDPPEKKEGVAVRSLEAHEFARMCSERAASAPTGGLVAANGAVIEQQQILTTQNLAVLFDAADLAQKVDPSLLGQRTFDWLTRRLSLRWKQWQAELQAIKNAAYAWRQMVFYLSLVPPADQRAFLGWSKARLGRRPESFQQRLRPLIGGLEVAIGGRRLVDGDGTRRFLGWSLGRHWLAGARAPS